jgi:pectin methylesterase-like acyl-CoA thioesterase
MKRIRSVLAAVAVLAVVASTLLVAAPAAFAGNTVIVPTGGSIQAAVTAAAPGTTIIVSPGVYHESVVIQKNGIHIRGAFNQANPVLDPTGEGREARIVTHSEQPHHPGGHRVR